MSQGLPKTVFSQHITSPHLTIKLIMVKLVVNVLTHRDIEAKIKLAWKTDKGGRGMERHCQGKREGMNVEDADLQPKMRKM